MAISSPEQRGFAECDPGLRTPGGNLANKPRLLLADEPTGNLDSRTSREIMELLKGLNEQEGKAIVLVTNDANLAAQYARRTITLMDGTVQKESWLAPWVAA